MIVFSLAAQVFASPFWTWPLNGEYLCKPLGALPLAFELGARCLGFGIHPTPFELAKLLATEEHSQVESSAAQAPAFVAFGAFGATAGFADFAMVCFVTFCLVAFCLASS